MRLTHAVSPLLAVALLATPALGQEAPQNATRGLVSIEVEKTKTQGYATPPMGPLPQSDGCLDPAKRLSLEFDWLSPIHSHGSRVVVSKGIGFVARADGVVVTSHDLVAGAARITVTLRDGRQRTGEVVSVHSGTHTAVPRIEVEGDSLPTLALRDSTELVPGARLSLATCNRQACSQEGCRYPSGVFMGCGWRSGDQEGEVLALFSGATTTLPGAPLLSEDGDVVGLNARFTTVALLSATVLQFAHATPVDTARRLVAELPFREPPLTPKFTFDGLDWDAFLPTPWRLSQD